MLCCRLWLPAALLCGGAAAQDLFVPSQPTRKFDSELSKDSHGFEVRRYTAKGDASEADGRRLHWLYSQTFAVDLSDYPELCAGSIVEDTCKLFNGDPEDAAADTGLVEPSAVHDGLQASVEGVADFWEAVGLPVPARCMDLCKAAVALLKQHDHVMPERSQLGCYKDFDTGEHNCNIPLKPDDIAPEKGAEDPFDENASSHGGDALDVDNHQIGPPEEEEENEDEDEEEHEADHTLDEIAVEIAQMFQIYPEIAVDVEVEDDDLHGDFKAEEVWTALRGNFETGRRLGTRFESQISATKQKAVAYLATATREFNRRNTRQHMQTWFGRHAFEDPQSRHKVKEVLASTKDVIVNVHYKYPGPQCEDNTYAYVYPHGVKCTRQELAYRPCRNGASGKLVFYMCPLTMRSRMSVQIETLTHEASHHGFAYTDDVCVDNSRPCQHTAYGRDTCKHLAQRSPDKALHNADSYCYYIQDITDVR